MRGYDKALADLSRAIELDPAGATAYAGRWAVYKAMGHEDDAAADYSRAIELEPRFSDMLSSLRSKIPPK
jgi:Tfp pilus assembly protein PilF